MAFNERAKMSDVVTAGLDTAVIPPEHPCGKCGATTKRHHDLISSDGEVIAQQRICFNRVCAHVVRV